MLENLLSYLAQCVIKRPRFSLLATLLVTGILSLGLSHLAVDVTNESMFRSGDPSLKQFQQFQSQFGRDDVAIAAIASEHIFTPTFFQRLESYHRALEARVPYLDRVTSLVNATSVSVENGVQNGDILIDDLGKRWPLERDKFSVFAEEVVNNPLYKNLLITADGSTTLLIIRASVFAEAADLEAAAKDSDPQDRGWRQQITHWHDQLLEQWMGDASGVAGNTDNDFFAVLDERAVAEPEDGFKPVQPLSTPQLQAFIRELKTVSDEHRGEGFQIRLLGGSMIADAHVQSIHRDFAGLLPVTFLLVFVALFLMMRCLAAALIPLLVVVLTLLVTLGLMGWLALPVTPVTIALPPLLLTIGVADSVHILSAFYQQFSVLGRDGAIIEAVKRTGLAVLFTSLTTIAGFFAFIMADIKPIADFGLLVGFGVALALLLSLILIPATLVLLYQRAEQQSVVEHGRPPLLLLGPMLALAQMGLRHAEKVLVAVAVIIGLCIPGIAQLQFSHNPLLWFPKDESVRINTFWADQRFSGTIPLEFVINTGKKNGLYDPLVMQRLERFQAYAESLQPESTTMGRSTSIVDTLKGIHWVLHQHKPPSPIPGSRDLVAQELLLFESSGADDVAELIDSDFSMARVTTRFSWVDAVDYLPLREQLLAEANVQFAGLAEVTATGSIDLLSRTLVNVMQSMGSSYLLAASVIALMLILLMRSLLLGLVSLVPNFLPIIISLGLMGYMGIPLDMFTVLLGGIALGLAVDDTVHFIHRYRYCRQVNDLSIEESVRQTVVGVGPALLFTTLAMAAGFLVFLLSSMQVVVVFGLLLALTIVNALVLDLLVTPALLKVIDRRGLVSITAEKKLVNSVVNSG